MNPVQNEKYDGLSETAKAALAAMTSAVWVGNPALTAREIREHVRALYGTEADAELERYFAKEPASDKPSET